ncbi:MAG: YdeI/OmpD-associated family protein [Thermoflexales bacterium]|nr:YdeI/OmpD-associated family protein [Thermoflexales bacterium]
MSPTFFPTPADFRRWLQAHHATEKELLVGFYKTGSGQPSITWPESVDQALCFGWIDGLRKRVDDERYTIRFTPRKPTSTWSAVNIKRVEELTQLGLMTPAGLKAFEARQANKSGIYSYEQRTAELPPAYDKVLKANRAAWTFFQAQPASYRKAAMWWIVSAKQETTRLKRLEQLIDLSAHAQQIPQFTRWKK